ncbi:hypothetical protein GCM10009809_26970 [Isoptericola hypogeus]|uniref:Gram-positive cocci surface proteins LPxTG domain-containing protein n=1 Tax=Isoptericola hypogeus TaxID=300179 RepID=A0ABN2JKZ4_9MICO
MVHAARARTGRPTMPPAGLAARVALGAVVAAGMGIAGATAAAADTVPSPSPSPTEYVPPEEPSITADILQPICDGDVPYLQYAVTVTGTDSNTVSITWINPGGADVVQSGLPLSGRVLWPGAEVAADGSPLDWPGWRLVDGVWVEGDEFDWVRPSVDLLLEVNPELSATAAYPPSSPNCATNPPGTPPDNPPTEPGETVPAALPPADAPPSSSWLPQTGAEVATLAAVAAGLVAVGALTVAAVRRRRTEH